MPLFLLPLLLAFEPGWQDLRDSGLRLEAAGQFAQAESHFAGAIRLAYTSAAAPHHLASLYNNLGHVQISRAHYLAAESSLKRALALHERQPIPKDIEWTFVLNNLAVLYQQTGRIAEAEAAQRRALDGRLAALGPHHPLVANVQVTLAALRAANRQYSEARALLDAALLTFQQSPGHVLQQAGVLVNLANLAVHQQHLSEALTFVRQACRLYDRHAAPNHPSRIQAQLTLAHILRDQHQYTAAETAAREAIRLLAAAHPDGHPSFVKALTILADALAKTGRKPEARQARTQAEAMARSQRAANPQSLTVPASTLSEQP